MCHQRARTDFKGRTAKNIEDITSPRAGPWFTFLSKTNRYRVERVSGFA